VRGIPGERKNAYNAEKAKNGRGQRCSDLMSIRFPSLPIHTIEFRDR